ncbi:MAG: glycosyltransferase [Trueperaceae bacterium]
MSEPTPVPSDARCAILIPAKDEAERVGSVVAVALRAGLGLVLVVDDGSRDATALVADGAGAEVLRLGENRGKGGALLAGAEHLEQEVLVLLDADLVGLRPEHVRALADPVLAGEVEMTRGVFHGARWSTTAAQRIAPQLGGQRGIVRERLLEVQGLADSRYGVEIRIGDTAFDRSWTWRDVPLPGVSQVTKEEKDGWWRGVRNRVGMYRDIVRSWWSSRH